MAVFIGVAEAQLQAGHGREGLNHARDAIARCDKISCGSLRPVALTTLGLAQLQTGSVAKAQRTLEDALAKLIADDAPPSDVARARFILAQAWARLGELDKARALATQAVEPLARRKDYALTSRELQAFLLTLGR